MILTPKNARDGITIRKVGDISQPRKLHWSQELEAWYYCGWDGVKKVLPDSWMRDWEIVEQPAVNGKENLAAECHTCLHEGLMITAEPCKQCCRNAAQQNFTKWEPQHPSGSLAVEAALPTIIEDFRVLVDTAYEQAAVLIQSGNLSIVAMAMAQKILNTIGDMQEILGDSGEANHGE